MDKNMDFALFKFQIIAPVLNDNKMVQKKYFEQMAEKTFDLSFTKQTKFSSTTFKKWLYLYKKYGLDALKGQFRKDKGSTRVISDELKEKIKKLATEYNFRTITNLYEYLIQQEIIYESDFTYATLNSFLRKNNIFNSEIQKKERKAFEMPHINMLWMTDFMYGPYVYSGKSKTRTYLCAIIDDHSRVVTSASFYITQTVKSLEQTLKNAICKFGVPNKLYCDNGKVFIGGYFQVISARLGFVIVHSGVHDAPPRGKIERLFHTVRDRFIPKFYIENKDQRITLDLLNNSFSSWLNNDYNNKIHSGIKQKPLDRYFKDTENVKIRKIPSNQIDPIFYHTIYRRVNNDSTIPYNNTLYELPAKYIGKKVELRFDSACDHILYLFENDKQILRLKELNKHENAMFPIRFNKEEQ